MIRSDRCQARPALAHPGCRRAAWDLARGSRRTVAPGCRSTPRPRRTGCLPARPAPARSRRPGTRSRRSAGTHRRHRRFHRFAHFRGRRPDLLQVHRLTVRVVAQGIVGGLDVHRARQGIGDHEGRRRQEGGPHQRVNAPLEVRLPLSTAATTRSLSRTASATGFGSGPRCRCRSCSRSRRGGSAATRDRGAVRVLQVARHRAGPGGQARLDPRAHAQASLDGLLGQEHGADQHHGVRRIGTARNRRDGHGPIAHAGAHAVQSNLDLWARSVGRVAIAAEDDHRESHGAPGSVAVDPAVAAAGQARLDGRQVELQQLAELRRWCLVVRNSPCSLQ